MRMPPTERWPEVPARPAAAASLANFFSMASSAPETRKTTFIFDRAAIKTAARFDGVIEEFSLRVVALLDGRDSAERSNPFENQAGDVHRKRWRRVIQGLVVDVCTVLKDGWQLLVGTLGKIFADDDQGDARGAQIFLRAGEDEAEFLYLDGPRSDVGGHVGDERYVARVGNGGPLRAFDGVVGAEVHVGSVRRESAFGLTRQTPEPFRLARGGHLVGKTFFELANRFGSPQDRVQHVNGLYGQAKVHGDHGELQAASAL